MVMPVKRWIICFAGWMQHEGKPIGMVRLWDDLCREHNGPDTRVLFYRWDHPVGDIAELMWRLGRDANVMLVGYSWGGMTAVNLARQLCKRRVAVDQLVLCDAVYRHWYWLGQWRALVPRSVIYVPRNVRRVTWFRQNWTLPRGHVIKAESPARTGVGKPIPPVGFVAHKHMDDMDSFHQLAKEHAAN